MPRSACAICWLRGPTNGRARSRTSARRWQAAVRRVARIEPTGPARSGRPDDRLRSIRGSWRRASTRISLPLNPGYGFLFEITPHQLRRERHVRIVFRRVFDLHQIVEAGILVDAVGAGDQPRRPRRIAVAVLMDGARRNVDDVTGFPVVALDLVLRLPLVGVGDLDIAVLVQVVAETLDHIEALLGEMAMFS